jgi:hypothetical protein
MYTSGNPGPSKMARIGHNRPSNVQPQRAVNHRMQMQAQSKCESATNYYQDILIALYSMAVVAVLTRLELITRVIPWLADGFMVHLY